MISLPLNTWIISLEDDATSLELRQKLCSVHVVVGIIIILNHDCHNCGHNSHNVVTIVIFVTIVVTIVKIVVTIVIIVIIVVTIVIIVITIVIIVTFVIIQVRVMIQQICVCSSFLTGAFRFFLVLHADGLIRKDEIFLCSFLILRQFCLLC